MSLTLEAGQIALADLNPVAGRDQGGRRPVVVVSHRRYGVIPGLFLAVPLTATFRGLPHHVRIDASSETGLDRVSYAMTEQIRAMSLSRIDRVLGRLDPATFGVVSRFLHMFIA